MDKPSYYAIIPAEVRYSEDLSANEKLMYGEITCLSSSHGECWATNSYFAKLYGVKEETVSRWISGLEKAGFITRHIVRGENKMIVKRSLKINTGLIKKSIPSPQKDQDPIDEKIKENNTSINNTRDNNNVAIAPETEIDSVKETGERIANAPTPQVPPHPPSPTENALAKQVFDYYNEKRGNMSEAMAMTNQRKSAIKARLKEYGEETVRGAIDMAAESDFLQGRTDCAFSCGIDWLMGPKNFIKVVEGNYKNKVKAGGVTRTVNTDLI